jgi:hypothetical protein
MKEKKIGALGRPKTYKGGGMRAFYQSHEAGKKLDKLSEEVNRNRSQTVENLINFGNAHIVNFKAWVESEGSK